MVGINSGTIISRLSFLLQSDLVMQFPSGTRLLASSRKVVLSFHLRRDRQLVSIIINTNLNNWNVRSPAPGRRQHEKTSKTQEERGTLANAPTGCRVSIRSLASLASVPSLATEGANGGTTQDTIQSVQAEPGKAAGSWSLSRRRF